MATFHASFENNRPQAAEVNVSVKPEEPKMAAPLDLDLGWKSDQTVALHVAIEGVKAHADFDIAGGEL